MSTSHRIRGSQGLAARGCLAVFLLLAGGVAAEENEAVHKIRDKLTKPTQIAFNETPLSEVAVFLKDVHDIHIEFNRRALQDAGIAPEDTLITRFIKGVALKSTLNLILAEHGLTYVIQDEVLMITTPQDARANSMPQVYDVNDLAPDDGFDAEKLIAVVYLALDPDPQGQAAAQSAGVDRRTEEMLARIVSYYQRYDSNGDGRFDVEEIAQSARLSDRLRQHGLDPKRPVSLQEFARQRVRAIFSQQDESGSGSGRAEGPRAGDEGTVDVPSQQRVQVFRGRLIMRASQPEHDRVRELLDRLRKTGKPGAAEGGAR